MDLRQEIVRQLDVLPEDLQTQVLRFVESLTVRTVLGERGAALRRAAPSLDSDSPSEMIQAIEEGCEQVEAGGW